MKERMRRILCCMGTVGAMAFFMTVPVRAEGYDWSDKAAANVLTYANIREEADVNSERIGYLPSGAVATVTGTENGWTKVTSGGIEGYIREDLLVTGDAARDLYEAMYGTIENTEEEEAAETALIEEVDTETAKETEEVVEASKTEPVKPAQTTDQASVPAGADMDLMAAIIECEAGGESYDGKVGVGAVIMNRIRSNQFPNTLSDVIYQSGQFEPAATGKLAQVLNRGASAACYEAARDVFAGANTIGNRLFFHAGSGNGLTVGNQTFY